MIEIKSNRAVAFAFNAVKVTFYFLLIFYAVKIVHDYLIKYLTYMMQNDLTADFSAILFVLNLFNGIFEELGYEIILVLGFTFIYSLRNKYVFENGLLYSYKGIFYVKERTIPYSEISEVDFDKTLFDTGNIVVRLHQGQKPVIIPYVSRVKERFEEIKKEVKLQNEKRVSKQIQEVGTPSGSEQGESKAGASTQPPEN
ncbi:PH domain-containing protein [Candidatus Woesearchaeota archaeon]|nr:PH domain-containing protein [Candidatus Woesearchaeota archaeon]